MVDSIFGKQVQQKFEPTSLLKITRLISFTNLLLLKRMGWLFIVFLYQNDYCMEKIAWEFLNKDFI